MKAIEEEIELWTCATYIQEVSQVSVRCLLVYFSSCLLVLKLWIDLHECISQSGCLLLERHSSGYHATEAAAGYGVSAFILLLPVGTFKSDVVSIMSGPPLLPELQKGARYHFLMLG